MSEKWIQTIDGCLINFSEIGRIFCHFYDDKFLSCFTMKHSTTFYVFADTGDLDKELVNMGDDYKQFIINSFNKYVLIDILRSDECFFDMKTISHENVNIFKSCER